MVQQFVKDPFSVPDPKAPQGSSSSIMIDPAQLIGTYQYDIVAANYATSKIVRQRNMMALAKILEQNPFIDPYAATRELLKTFDIQHVDQLMKTKEQVQMEQQQQMQQQMQMMLLQHQMETQQKVAVAEATPPAQVVGGNKSEGGGHKPGGKGKKPGRKSSMQHEGQIPGSGTTSMARLVSQNLGANALGLGQMGEIPNAG
jgi:hypothetical protein